MNTQLTPAELGELAGKRENQLADRHNLITLTEAAQRANMKTSSLRRAIHRGDLPAQKFGKTWLVIASDFNEWLTDKTKHKRGKKSKTKD